ncbi:MAG: trypsin-like serine protease [Bacteriovoracaceae bacterium]|nr:trypsin-like serine protease [Bacteriovoracaceae bacterium]
MKGIIIIALLGLISSTYAVEKNQCGLTDDRVPSNELPVGRMLKKTDSSSGCTGTLISKSCVVSAGHCKDYAAVIEFNTEPSLDKVIVHPGPESVYFKNDVIDSQSFGTGLDWMVYRTKPNAITGKFAGDIQGTYEYSFEVPKIPLELAITGYGQDDEPSRNYAQQIGHGELMPDGRSRIRHNIDTLGGNSGAAIVERETSKIIGIHTHGGCLYGTNIGTMLAARERFQKAIDNCIQMEKDDLNR